MPQHQLYGLRGRAYVAKYKQLYADLKDQIADDVHRIKVENGKFTIYDFGSLCMKYRLPTTAMDDFLNSILTLPPWPSGTWERIRDRNKIKAKDIGVIWGDD